MTRLIRCARSVLALTLLLLLIGSPLRVEGSGVPRAIGLPSPPAGSEPGDHFRYLIVTQAIRDALSSDIAEYDSFVALNAGSYFSSDWRPFSSSSPDSALAYAATVPSRIPSPLYGDPKDLLRSEAANPSLSTDPGDLYSAIVRRTFRAPSLFGIPIGTGYESYYTSVSIDSVDPFGVTWPTRLAPYSSFLRWSGMGFSARW